MAYSVSQDFKTKIKDGITPQKIALVFSDLYFTDEDIEQNGVSISETFSTDEHLSFGACPSAVLSFGVIAKSLLSGYEFGDCSVYIGVQVSTASFTMPAGTNAYVVIGANVWTATASGVFVNGARISSGRFNSLLYDGTDLYAFGSTFSLKINPSDNSFVTYLPHKFMAQKMLTPHSIAVTTSGGVITGASVWGADTLTAYEFCPMGVFMVEKPKKTVGEVVTIQDAYDRMKLFDVDATEFLSSLTYPKTLSQIYVALCNYIGVGYVSATFPYSTVSYANSPFSDASCSCREILSWIAERARKVAKFDRTGRLDLVWVGSSVTESLTTSDIGMDDYDCSEYHTEAVTGVLLKSTSGTSLSFGSMDNPYSIMGNPFISTITNSDLADYESIPTYIPMSLRVIEADPSVEVGDMLSVADLADAYQVLADIYGNVWSVGVGDPEFRLHAKEDGTLYAKSDNHAIGQYRQEYEALSVSSDQFQIPLMERTITYIGHCSATYESTGERWREVDTDMNVQYNANVAPVSQMDVFNRLTNGGQDQGIYIDNGKIYINGEYIRANSINADLIYGGTLSGAEINIGNGAFTVDSTGTVGITKGELNISFSGAGTEQNKFIIGRAEIPSNGRTYTLEVAPYGVWVDEVWTSTGDTMNSSSYSASGYLLSGTSYNGGNTWWHAYLLNGVFSMQENFVTRIQMFPDLGNNTIFRLNDANGKKRIELTLSGLYIYNSDGTLKASYT